MTKLPIVALNMVVSVVLSETLDMIWFFCYLFFFFPKSCFSFVDDSHVYFLQMFSKLCVLIFVILVSVWRAD